jgi:hypothetical protein
MVPIGELEDLLSTLKEIDSIAKRDCEWREGSMRRPVRS